MISEGTLLGLLVAADKPGGFTDADVQLLSHLRRARRLLHPQPADLRPRSARHAAPAGAAAALAGEHGRRSRAAPSLLALVTARVQADLGYERVAFYAADEQAAAARGRGPGRRAPRRATPADPELLRLGAARGSRPLPSTPGPGVAELAVPSAPATRRWAS